MDQQLIEMVDWIEKIRINNRALLDVFIKSVFLASYLISPEILKHGGKELGEMLCKKFNGPENCLPSALIRLGHSCSYLLQKITNEIDDTNKKESDEQLMQVMNQLLSNANYYTDDLHTMISPITCIKYANNLKSESQEAGRFFNNIGNYLRETALYAKAEDYYTKALKIRKMHLEKKHDKYKEFIDNLLTLYYEQDNFIEKRLMPDKEKFFGESGDVPLSEYCDYAETLNCIAVLYCYKWKYEKAEPMILKALIIYEALLGDNNLKFAVCLNNLSFLYRFKKLAEAEKMLKRSKSVIENLEGRENDYYATSINNEASFYLLRHEYDKAKELYEESLKIRKNVFGENHPKIAESYNNLALAYKANNNTAEAEALYAQAVSKYIEALGSAHPYVAAVYHNQVLIYDVNDNKSKPLIEKANEINKKVFANENPYSIGEKFYSPKKADEVPDPIVSPDSVNDTDTPKEQVTEKSYKDKIPTTLKINRKI